MNRRESWRIYSSFCCPTKTCQNTSLCSFSSLMVIRANITEKKILRLTELKYRARCSKSKSEKFTHLSHQIPILIEKEFRFGKKSRSHWFLFLSFCSQMTGQSVKTNWIGRLTDTNYVYGGYLMNDQYVLLKFSFFFWRNFSNRSIRISSHNTLEIRDVHNVIGILPGQIEPGQLNIAGCNFNLEWNSFSTRSLRSDWRSFWCLEFRNSWWWIRYCC